MKLALLEYAFLFDPSETWANVADFENDLVEVFKSAGLDAELIQSISEPGKRVIFLQRSQKPSEPQPETTKTTDPRQMAKNLK